VYFKSVKIEKAEKRKCPDLFFRASFIKNGVFVT